MTWVKAQQGREPLRVIVGPTLNAVRITGVLAVLGSTRAGQKVAGAAAVRNSST